MDFVKIYYQYQKQIAVAERMRLHEIPAREPVMAGAVEAPDLLPTPDLPEPEGVKKEIWQPIGALGVAARLRQARN